MFILYRKKQCRRQNYGICGERQLPRCEKIFQRQRSEILYLKYIFKIAFFHKKALYAPCSAVFGCFKVFIINDVSWLIVVVKDNILIVCLFSTSFSTFLFT